MIFHGLSHTLACAFTALFLLCGPSPAADARPNILWLLAEDVGPEAFSNAGTPEAHTPVIDQLAGDGVRYTRAYTTAPVCSPSRTAIITGMYATTLGGHNHRTQNKPELPEGVRILTDRLREVGYFTANVVSFPPKLALKGAGKTDWNFKREGPAFDGKDWAELKSHQPFYAQVNFSETHRTYHAPAESDPAKIALPPYYPDHPVARKDWAEYLDSARELDRKVGRLLAQLAEDGLAENTIVVFMGDNGQSHIRGKQFLYEEGLHVPLIIRWPKGFPVPPGFTPGKDNARLLEAIDLTATTLSWAGIKKPAGMQGRIFMGADAEPPREMVFGHRDRMDETVMRHRTVRDERFRYIKNFTPEKPFFSPNAYKAKQYPMWNLMQQLHAEGKLNAVQEALCQPAMPAEELYDLEADPHEINNLAASDAPEHQAALKKLRAALEHWIEQTNDHGRLPDPDNASGTKPKARG
jgi:arylsulfatase A-like enzyme